MEIRNVEDLCSPCTHRLPLLSTKVGFALNPHTLDLWHKDHLFLLYIFSMLQIDMSSAKCSCRELQVHTCMKHAYCVRAPVGQKTAGKWNPSRCRDCIRLVAEGYEADDGNPLKQASGKWFTSLSSWAYRVSSFLPLYPIFSFSMMKNKCLICLI